MSVVYSKRPREKIKNYWCDIKILNFHFPTNLAHQSVAIAISEVWALGMLI